MHIITQFERVIFCLALPVPTSVHTDSVANPHSLLADVTAIIFVIACSSFNMVIREDEKTVRCADIGGDIVLA